MYKISTIILAILLGVTLTLGGCMSNKLDYYKDTQPKADIKQFFNGPIKGYGLIQDWSGKVVSRFDVDMVGKWQGNKGILEEEFTYYDGSKQHRTWHITKLADGTYEGSAEDIIGKATGAQQGSAVKWAYYMDVPVKDKTYRLKFDDWMWQMNDNIIINRSYLKKFGFTVAELTLFMQKQ